MTNIWEPGKDYYVELNQGELKELLGELLEGIIKYKPRKDGQPWTLERCMRHVKYLPGNKVAISIQITNSGYVEWDNGSGELINTGYVIDKIDSEDFDLALYMLGVTEVMTKEEYDALIPVEETI